MVNEVIRLEDLDAAWPRLQAKVCHAARVGLRLGLRPTLTLPLPLPLTLTLTLPPNLLPRCAA
jgi:hypothetical protein